MAAWRRPLFWLRQKQRSWEVCIASLGMGSWRRCRLREYGRVGLLTGNQVGGAAGLLSQAADPDPSLTPASASPQ